MFGAGIGNSPELKCVKMELTISVNLSGEVPTVSDLIPLPVSV